MLRWLQAVEVRVKSKWQPVIGEDYDYEVNISRVWKIQV